MNNTILINGFWDRVDKTIQQSGMTQNEISRRMGYPEKYITEAKRHWNMPNSGALAKFCGVTGASADFLLGLKGDRDGQF